MSQKIEKLQREVRAETVRLQMENEYLKALLKAQEEGKLVVDKEKSQIIH